MKAKLALKDIEKLLTEAVFPFYAIERDMLWPNDLSRHENNAEHSWSLSLVACSLVTHIDPELDIGLVCQFAIIHDLVELYAGDTSFWAQQEEHDSKEDREHQALEKIKKNFTYLPWLTKTLERYELQDSAEARYVRAVDKLLALYTRFLDKGYYYKKHHYTKEKFEAQLARHRQKAHGHPGVAKYYEKLLALWYTKSEYFYQEESV